MSKYENYDSSESVFHPSVTPDDGQIKSYDLTNVINYSSYLSSCSSLTNIEWVGERTTNFSLSTLRAPSFTQIAIKELVNKHLGTVESATLTLGEAYLAYLTEEEIASAVSKGWTLQ